MKLFVILALALAVVIAQEDPDVAPLALDEVSPESLPNEEELPLVVEPISLNEEPEAPVEDLEGRTPTKGNLPVKGNLGGGKGKPGKPVIVDSAPMKQLSFVVSVPSPPVKPIVIAPYNYHVPIPKVDMTPIKTTAAMAGAAAKKGALLAGKILLAPVTLTAAKTSALLGKALALGGMKVGLLGGKVALVGGKTAAAGAGLGALGAGLAKHTFGGWLPLSMPISIPSLGWLSSGLGNGNIGADGSQYLVDTPYVQVYKNVVVGPQPIVKNKKQGPNGLKGKSEPFVDQVEPVELAEQVQEQAARVNDGADQLEDVQQQVEDAELAPEVRRKRSVETQPILPFARAMRLLHSIDIKECIARVICELSCDLKAHGPNGEVVFNNLLKLQTSEHGKSSELKVYREALVNGRRFAISRRNFGKKSCEKCATKVYKQCKAATEDLVSVASMIRVE